MSFIRFLRCKPVDNGAIRGFGLIELMIALALGMVIILGVTTLFTDSSRALNDINRAGRYVENSLYAMDLISKDVALVGYWGEANALMPPDNPNFGALRAAEIGDLNTAGYTDLPPPLCAGTGATGFDPRIELGWAMAYPLLAGQGLEADVEVGVDPCNTSGSTAWSKVDYVAVRRASTCAIGDNCRAVGNFFHLQTNGCNDPNANLSGGEVKLYQVSADTVASTLDYRRYGCADAAPVYRFVSRIYFVNYADELVRLDLDEIGGAALYQQEVLVEGVEVLRFQWHIDETGDGEYDRVETALSFEDAANVVGVRIWLMVRDTSPRTAYSDPNTPYEIAGETWAVPDGSKAYPRVLQTRMVMLPNRIGRRR